MTNDKMMTVENMDDEVLKLCCTAVYENEWTKLLLGDSFHPGGIALTTRLGELLNLSAADHLLDVAAGRGTSAIHLAKTFGCRVTAVEYGKQAVVAAQTAVSVAGVADLVTVQHGDAESLPCPDNHFDALICECAFCTFPDKQTAVSEFARVVKPGGRIGLSDLTRSGPLPAELEGLLGWIACIADAQPVEQYKTYLQNGGFQMNSVENHNGALTDMIRSIQGKLLGAEIMIGLNKLTLPNLDFKQAKSIACHAAQAARQGKLGYALLLGELS
jgi:ubiquinone/menaquinone biosynthesis C-methylase UbiE